MKRISLSTFCDWIADPATASRQANDTNDGSLPGDLQLQRFYRVIIP
jgi:hypothetical protein